MTEITVTLCSNQQTTLCAFIRLVQLLWTRAIHCIFLPLLTSDIFRAHNTCNPQLQLELSICTLC